MMLALGLLVSGLCATVSAKAAARRGFRHPVMQTLAMFVGETLLLVTPPSGTLGAFYKSDFRPPLVVFLLLAALDLAGTTLVFVGLRDTDASTYMMLRTVLVPATGVLSAIVARTMPPRRQVVGTLFVVAALVMVGLASRAESSARTIDDTNSSSTSAAALGAALVVAAQMVLAAMMVVEESLYRSYDDLSAAVVVGLEGIIGCFLACIALAVCSSIDDPNGDGGKVDSLVRGLVAMHDDPTLIGLILVNLLAVSGLNYFGNSVTKSMSAAHRTVLDALRIVLVWSFSLAAGWERGVSLLQLVGFLVLVLGIAFFNGFIRVAGLGNDDADGPTVDVEDYVLVGDDEGVPFEDTSDATTSTMIPGVDAHALVRSSL